VPSFTHGVAVAVGPAFTVVQHSLVFHGKDSRSCSRGRGELQVPKCAGKQDLSSSESFFSFFLWLVAFVFVDSEKALLLTGYGTLCLPSLSLQSSFFKIVNHCWAIGISTVCHLAPCPKACICDLLFNTLFRFCPFQASVVT
jgi:hypothetical protein